MTVLLKGFAYVSETTWEILEAIEEKFNIWLKKAEQIYRACGDIKVQSVH